MAVEIKHKFQSAVPDGPNTGFVRPSNWNDTHNISMEGECLIGKPTAGVGAAQEVTLGAGLEFSAGSLVVTFGTTAGTVAAGNDSRITGAVQKDGTGQVLTGQYSYTSHDYGKLSDGNIEILATKHFGVIERDNTSNEITAPSTPPDHHIAIRILIVGTSSTGSPSLTGWDNIDQGDDLPKEDEMAWLRIDLAPEAMTAVVEAINY